MKKKIVIANALVLGVISTACAAPSEPQNSIISSTVNTTELTTVTLKTTVEKIVTSETTATQTEISSEDYVKYIKQIVEGDVGKGEVIKDITLEKKELIVYVDISGAQVPQGFSLEDIALSRTSSITDSILEFSQYDYLCNSIVIDFGSLGQVKNTKANIVDSEYGRYFDNFKLKK